MFSINLFCNVGMISKDIPEGKKFTMSPHSAHCLSISDLISCTGLHDTSSKDQSLISSNKILNLYWLIILNNNYIIYRKNSPYIQAL